MAQEFKKLGEVDIVETASDNANVMIIEDGEVKQILKSKVGGAGGYIHKLTASSVTDQNDYGYVISDNYDAIYEVLNAGGSVWIDISEMLNPSSISTFASDGYGGYGGYEPTGPWTTLAKAVAAVECWYLADTGLWLELTYTVMGGNDTIVLQFPNGSHNATA